MLYFQIETSTLHFIHHSIPLHAIGLFQINSLTFLQVIVVVHTQPIH